MLNWIISYKNSSRQTKFFALTWFVYGIAIIITTIYCYARLDYVRSYKTPKPPKEEIKT